MSYDSVANEIVSNSIRSAICIDDENVGPYDDVEKKKRDKSKQLWESFKKSNCSLDIYTFKDYSQLQKESEFIFKNRDLMILDWELSNEQGQDKFKDTLYILKDAVENPGLAFVLIYTKVSGNGLDGIEMQIRSYFNQKNTSMEERDQKYFELLSSLNDEFFFKETGDNIPDSAETFFKEIEIQNAFGDFFMKGPADEAIKEFKTLIRKYFHDNTIGGKFYKLFEEKITKLYNCNTLFEGCEQLEFHLKKTFIAEELLPSSLYCHKIHNRTHALWSNNTYIIIFNKNEFTPKKVYKEFSESLYKKPGSIMTLISLEMKNNFKENSAKVGKDLLAVDELAFFHHHGTLKDNEEFYDFLRNNWKHQVALFHLNSDLKIFPVLEEYIKNNHINEQIDKKKKGSNPDCFRKELARLNYQYSFHHAVRKEKDYLRFGDIFNIRDSAESKSTRTDKYLLNITAHCDCLRPTKIYYHFHFVRGQKYNLNNALENATSDNHCFSFYFRDNEPLCISWDTKPFTIYIPETNRFFSPESSIEINIDKETKFLCYEGMLLENYAQRIANKSFAHAARVGIDLLEWKVEHKK